MNDTIKAIVELLQEGKPELQVAAAQVLGELKPKDAAVVEALGDGPDRSPVLGRFCLDALAKIADTRPQIIFVDIMMPRLDGYQTCALIKNNSEFKSTPVIMLSSKDGLFDKAKGRVVGSDQYLTKPFSKSELLGAIEAHVSREVA